MTITSNPGTDVTVKFGLGAPLVLNFWQFIQTPRHRVAAQNPDRVRRVRDSDLGALLGQRLSLAGWQVLSPLIELHRRIH